MLLSDNAEIEMVQAANADDLTIGDLLAQLAGHADKPLVFYYDGRPIRGGYHVTEVKAGQFSALDCGSNPEVWPEVFVQLLDAGNYENHMSAGKFAAIIRKVGERIPLDRNARLTFEVSDGIRPMQMHRASLPLLSQGAVHVDLSPRPASCKPRDRSLGILDGGAKAQPCCG